MVKLLPVIITFNCLNNVALRTLMDIRNIKVKSFLLTNFKYIKFCCYLIFEFFKKILLKF